MLHGLALKVFGVLPRKAKTAVVRTFYPTFTAGVGVCLTNPAGDIALVRHSYSPGWGLPGGLIEKHEEFRTTAERELGEELGLDVSLEGRAVPVLTPGRRHFSFLFTAGLSETQATGIESQSPEIIDVGWFPLDALPELAEYNDLFLAELGLLTLE